MRANREGLSEILWEHAVGLRVLARDARGLFTEGERALISRAADNVAAAYRIISTGDPNAS